MTTIPRPPLTSGQWTSLVGTGLSIYLKRRIALLSDLNYWTTNTARLQRQQLRSILARAHDTEFGRTHNLQRLAALPDRDIADAWRKTVPVQDWYAYKDSFARMREHGESNVLWPGLITDYAQTSGTTAGDKFIPVSQEMFKSNYRASLDIFAHMHRFGLPLSRVTAGKCFFLGGSTNLDTNQHGIRTGDLSALVTKLIRWPISEIYSPGPEIALMIHWPSKIEAMAQLGLTQDVRFISGVPSWALMLFERVLEIARKKGHKADTIQDIWPNLQIFVHGGVKYPPFDQRIRQFWSGSATGADLPFRLELYPASEGFIAMQDTKGDPGLRLMSDIGLYAEFVPLEQINDPNPEAFTADTVDKGQKYVVCLTTCAGLYRYVLGDVVEFDTLPANLDGKNGEGPARLRIVGRHKHFMNAFGENLIGEHIELAVAKAAKDTGLVVGEFTAAPLYPKDGQRGAVELAVEIEAKQPITPDLLARFAHAFDQGLKDQNVDYTTKRTDNFSMVEPRVTPMPLGTVNRWMSSRGKLGGQNKVPRCANHRDFVDAVVAVAKSETQ